MAKYRKRPVVIEAEIYKQGLEDGFESCGSLTCGLYNRFDQECSLCDLGKPYIDTLEGRHYISLGHIS